MTKHVSLKRWKQELRPYQEQAVNKALAVRQGGTLLLSAPTGTGKGTMEIGLLSQLRKQGKRAWIVTPSIEVLRGYLERCGASEKDLSKGAGALVSLGKSIYVTTPVRLRNWLKKGRRTPNGRRKLKKPDYIIMDEAHHAQEDNIAGGGLRNLLPQATFVGFTATAYRANPDETAKLHKFWGEPVHVLTVPQAIDMGVWALPKWTIKPILDDDKLEIVKGDIDADEASLLAAGPLCELIKTIDLSLPSCVTLPNVKSARELCVLLDKENISGQLVTADTPTTERSKMYHRVKTQCEGERLNHCYSNNTCFTSVLPICTCECADCKTHISDNRPSLLVSVRVLGEGVDLPWLRRWIDASPTLSPVSWLQKLGRITRPHESGQPEYVGTNRNLERHGYLLGGALPRSEFKIVQEKLGGGSRRPKTSTLKAVNQLKPIKIMLSGGIEGIMYAMWCPDLKGGSGFERCLIMDPANGNTVSATRRVHPEKADPKERTEEWVIEKKPPHKLIGFRAKGLTGKCTEKQLKFWNAQAENRGLSLVQPTETGTPSRAMFFALPMLDETKRAMHPDGKPLRPERERKPKVDAEGKPVAVKAPIEPSPVPDGTYTVIRGGAHKTYQLRTQSDNDVFKPGVQLMRKLIGPDNEADFKSVAEYVGDQAPQTPQTQHYNGCHVWAAHAASRIEIEDDWLVIRRNPEANGMAYAMRSGRCWNCNRKLTVPASLHSGLGPECSGRMADWRSKHQHAKREAEMERLDAESRDYEKDTTFKAKKQVHEETKGLSNIPLMKKLLLEGKPWNEIKRIYFERYTLEEKESGKEHKQSDSWKLKRIETYRKIAMDKLYTEGKQIPAGAGR